MIEPRDAGFVVTNKGPDGTTFYAYFGSDPYKRQDGCCWSPDRDTASKFASPDAARIAIDARGLPPTLGVLKPERVVITQPQLGVFLGTYGNGGLQAWSAVLPNGFETAPTFTPIEADTLMARWGKGGGAGFSPVAVRPSLAGGTQASPDDLARAGLLPLMGRLASLVNRDTNDPERHACAHWQQEGVLEQAPAP